MEKPGDLKFEVGQHAEIKTFVEGYRGAWFRCKIKDINLKKNQILPEYFDFPEEEISWTKIYELPHYGRKSKQIQKQLMVRPSYPQMYHKSEMPPVNSISELCVIIDGVWKVGDLVDWYKDDCYWSARVIKVLSDDMVKIDLPMPPSGQGGTYEAFCKDLRPSLYWSPTKGWTLNLHNMNGQPSCSAQLIFPLQQGMDIKKDEVASPLNTSSTSRISEISSAVLTEQPLPCQELKMDGSDDVEKASSSDTTCEDVIYNNIDLNIMHEETLEASVFDLEELANRIKWLRSILDNDQSKSGSWKFAGQC